MFSLGIKHHLLELKLRPRTGNLYVTYMQYQREITGTRPMKTLNLNRFLPPSDIDDNVTKMHNIFKMDI